MWIAALLAGVAAGGLARERRVNWPAVGCACSRRPRGEARFRFSLTNNDIVGGLGLVPLIVGL
jgi:hypothetical protein